MSETNTPGGRSRLIKYMGTSDVRVISKGESVMDTLPALPCDLRFKKSNNWTLDAAKFPEVDASWWDHLVANEGFADVTDQKVKPLNGHQKTFLGMKGVPAVDPRLDALSHSAPDPVDPPAVDPPADKKNDTKADKKNDAK